LAKKLVDIQVPQSILPDIVFEVVVKIPYDTQIKQVIVHGKKRALNVRAILILPKGFQLALSNRIPPEIKKR
jgi:apocytochrome f